ncbi:exodeoxyribonuclease-5 [Dyadobacter sp. BE34]|uniref:Exodeoxyribonuclease-5 n=1 Tax=Dyadobacter fermentans TaxID=94254 RepID=A0ABU1QYH4_9BACT|nr:MULTISPECIES: AAA family ATPase [Dyadobacter]MDR6806204.1 exodeoxyribonuclease-5 [Dyadobacter fermentans]MDR7043945.1 exodeoxyribonuclease-5 [Dyadobacter sp. BE242]MDR7198256.1 exodeoxyribonuclease-5 [Dyadobacter sp. BE34]MDR7216219.1 exodeoxyribonuclease-5 [Dyadobacter sp. BE31]MDR7264255.1 exodeoxyribonuclease-5 [Dyadobacter sp. BE32]
MDTDKLLPSQLLRRQFPFRPTDGQLRFFEKTNDFLIEEKGLERYRDCFLLKGYAGTGKTTIISTLIKVLKHFGYKSVLLAPTGRAAKVMSGYSEKIALTIHKKIYKQTADAFSGTLTFQRQKNYHDNTLFIVDEASMITDDADFGSRSLLADLVEFVFENPGNKLMLVGDTAQLPPVGKELSPALDGDYLERTFYMSVFQEELKEVMRQDEQSGILFNATQLRNQLGAEAADIHITTRSYRDVFKMTGEKLEEGLRYAYDKYGTENSIILTRSNKAAVQYNEYIRRVINFSEDELDAGDRLMVVRNNYNILDEDSPAGFIANGDFVELLKIRKTQEMHGFRFADVTLRLTDYEKQPEFDAKIFLDTLHSPSASMSAEDNKKLYESVQQDYFYIKSKKDRVEALRKDPYLNALQVKFAYALTCHKAQGGQWSAVFIDQGYLPEEQINAEFVRWLYTAITRATDEVFLMNFHQQFFK